MSLEKIDNGGNGKREHGSSPSVDGSDIDLLSFHEYRAGRLIIDPACVSCPFSYPFYAPNLERLNIPQ